MVQLLKEKIYESALSVLPIVGIVLAVSGVLVPVDIGMIALFLCGGVMLMIGMGLFSMGAEMSMIPMGENMGSYLKKLNKPWLLAIIFFLMGFIITVAEPDLQVLARQVPAIPSKTLIFTIAVGVGVFMIIGLLKSLLNINLSYLLIGLYLLIFSISSFVPERFIPMAFDSGGVTTGPITVPFILALGIGMSTIKPGRDSQEDDGSFGIVSLCSIGPIIAVMVLGIFFNTSGAGYQSFQPPVIQTTQDIVRVIGRELPETAIEVLTAVIPICGFFMIFQLVSKQLDNEKIWSTMAGLFITTVGLILFLTGVNIGFLPVGSLLGSEIARSGYRWLLIPVGMMIGYFIVAAEPAVGVLNQQIEKVTNGAVSAKTTCLCLSIGVAVSAGVSMLRILTGIPLHVFLFPGYAIALMLAIKTPKIFTGMAFDSGGVASGPMTTTFLLPFAIGACEALNGNVLTDTFGIVAMVAMTPLIAIQIMGIVSENRTQAPLYIK